MRSALLVLASLSLWAGSAAGSGGVHRFVAQPGQHAPECELASQVPGIGTFAYCLIGPQHALSVTMKANGHLTVCRGLKCMTDAPNGVRILKIGQSVNVGPFRCTSSRAGMRCIVTRLGHGFLLGRSALTRV